MKVDNWIETFTGKHVDIFHLEEEDIDINDIAHSLDLQCRFVGHCLTFYSVAKHCVLVADTVANLLPKPVTEDGLINKTCLAALLHDAAEAYIGDMSRYFKHHPALKFIIELEQQILGKVMLKYDCTGADWQTIKKADNMMLATEAKHNMASSGKGWYLPEPALSSSISPISGIRSLQIGGDAELMFLDRFEEYGGKH